MGFIIGFIGSLIYFIIIYITNSLNTLGIGRTLLFLTIASLTSFLFEFIGVKTTEYSSENTIT